MSCSSDPSAVSGLCSSSDYLGHCKNYWLIDTVNIKCRNEPVKTGFCMSEVIGQAIQSKNIVYGKYSLISLAEHSEPNTKKSS